MNGATDSIESIIKNMLYSMEGNEDFLKLIYIDDRSALDAGTPIPSISYKSLIKERLFPMERIAKPNEEAKSVVAIDFLNMSPSRSSEDVYNVNFTVDVYTSTDDSMWLLNGEAIRVYRLWNIVHDSILSSDLQTLSSRVYLSSATKEYFDIDRKFKGIRAIFTCENVS